jgi:hypothetical protein
VPLGGGGDRRRRVGRNEENPALVTEGGADYNSNVSVLGAPNRDPARWDPDRYDPYCPCKPALASRSGGPPDCRLFTDDARHGWERLTQMGGATTTRKESMNVDESAYCRS